MRPLWRPAIKLTLAWLVTLLSTVSFLALAAAFDLTLIFSAVFAAFSIGVLLYWLTGEPSLGAPGDHEVDMSGKTSRHSADDAAG